MIAPGPRGRHRGGRHFLDPRRGSLGVRIAAVAVGVVGAGLVVIAPSSAPGAPAAASASASPIPVPVSLAEGRSTAEAAAPTRVRLPALEVDSSLEHLGVDDSRALVPPSDFRRAGWFTGGPAPGDTGPAVIVGHVDSREGPAVFFRLAELTAGDDVLVDRADGTTARFTVVSVGRYPKDRFPTERVYGPTPRAELRLITCGGEFDRDARSYRDNVVVNAVLAS